MLKQKMDLVLSTLCSLQEFQERSARNLGQKPIYNIISVIS